MLLPTSVQPLSLPLAGVCTCVATRARAGGAMGGRPESAKRREGGRRWRGSVAERKQRRRRRRDGAGTPHLRCHACVDALAGYFMDERKHGLTSYRSSPLATEVFMARNGVPALQTLNAMR